MKKFIYGDNLNILREYIADESVDLIFSIPGSTGAGITVCRSKSHGGKSSMQIE
jgi:hypothetical protein